MGSEYEVQYSGGKTCLKKQFGRHGKRKMITLR
jgi:hypothetical protein